MFVRPSLSAPVWSSPATFRATGKSPEVIFRDFLVLLFFFSIFSALWAGLFGLVISLMKGGRKRYVAIENKSFDFELAGTNVDFLRIFENRRGRRFSVLLPELASQWLLRAWGRFCKSDSPSWFNQFCLGSDRFLLEYKRNRAGMFLQLS